MAKRRASGDGTLRKREDGRWEGRLVVGTKKNGLPLYKCFLNKSQKEVLSQMDLYKENLKGAELCEDYRMTLGDWLDKWLEEHMAFSIRESTKQGYRNISNTSDRTSVTSRWRPSLRQMCRKCTTSSKKAGAFTIIPRWDISSPTAWCGVST